MFAGKPYAVKHDSRGGDGRLLNGAGGGRLNHMRCRVADGAIRVGEPIRMKMRLLNADAYEKKDGAHDGKQKMSASAGRTIWRYFSHHYRLLYATLVTPETAPRPATERLMLHLFGACWYRAA